MARALDVLANADLRLDQWPDPPAEFFTSAISKSALVHTDLRCPALRRASAFTTTRRTWVQAAGHLHWCPGSNKPLEDVGYQRYEITEWLRGAATRTATLVDTRPVLPGELSAMFTALELIDLVAVDTRVRASVMRAWDVAYAIAAIAVDANSSVEGRLLAVVGERLTPGNPGNVLRWPGKHETHLDGQGTALRNGWDVLCGHLHQGVDPARAACLNLWAKVHLQDPTLTQLRHVSMTPAQGCPVGLDDLVQAWRNLFMDEATALLDYWIAQLQAGVAEYAHLPPFHISGRNGTWLQGVWPSVPGRRQAVEVPALVAVAVGGYDALRTLPASPAWPKAVLDLAADMAEETDATWAQALTAAAGVVA